jgi:hypothetical protein
MGNSTAETAGVIQPAKMTMCVQRSGVGLELTRRGCSVGGVGFLILWLTAWTAGCVMLAHQFITKREPFMLLFGIPFWASWFAVASYIAYGLFGFERLTIGRSGAEILKGVGPWTFKQRRIPLSELRRARLHKSSYEVNDQPVYGVEIRTAGKPITVAVGVESEEREWLIATINKEFDSLGVVDPTSEASDQSATRLESSPIAVERSSYVKPPPPPSDCTWEMQPTVMGSEFVRKGRFKLGTFAGLTFINLFWNGIVSVFVSQLIGLGPDNKPMAGGEWWFLFFFLIPFEVIGLIMIGAWVACLTTPAWREVLTLDRNEVAFRFSVFGIGRTKQFAALEIVAMDVQRRPPKKTTSPSLREDGEWQIVFTDKCKREVMRVKHLTEGEATWMAGNIRRMYPRMGR